MHITIEERDKNLSRKLNAVSKRVLYWLYVMSVIANETK